MRLGIRGKNLKNKTHIKEFAKYTSFNIIAMLSVSCYIIVDTFFISYALGTYGLAALNFSIPVFGFLFGTGLMLGIGGATRYTIKKSQGDHDGANRSFTNTIILSLGFIALLFICGSFFSSHIARLLGANDAVFEMSRIYIQVILLFSPILMTNTILGCFIRNDGAPKLAMLAMASNSLGNIVLDYIFIFRLDMEMFGAALATGLSAILSLIIFFFYFLMKKNGFFLVPCKLRFQSAKRILEIGYPAFLTEISISIVMITFNWIILGISGNIGVAAFGVIANILIVLIAIFNGIGQGTQPLFSRYYGKKDARLVRLMLKYAFFLMAAVSITFYLCILLLANPIAGIFNSEQNLLFQSLAVDGMRIYFSGTIFVGFNIIMMTYFAAIEKIRPAHTISYLRGFIIILPMVFLLSQIGGITGIWISFPITEFIVAAIALVLHLHNQKS